MEHIFEFGGNVFNLTTTRTDEGLSVNYQGVDIPVSVREVGEGMYVLGIEGKNVKVIVDGDTTNRFIEKYMEDWQPMAEPPMEALIAAALHDMRGFISPASTGREPSMGSDPYSPWKTLTSWRSSGGD